MVKSVRFKNIVIFSLSIFTFFNFSAFGMKKLLDKKQDEKSIDEIPYDCIGEIISFLNQEDALKLRLVNKSFAKSFAESPTVKLEISLEGKKKIKSFFNKNILSRYMQNKKFKKIEVYCKQNENVDFLQKYIKKFNSFSEKVSLYINGYPHINLEQKGCSFFHLFCLFFNKQNDIVSSGRLNKKLSLFNLQKLTINAISNGSDNSDIEFPSNLKEIEICVCPFLKVEKVVFPEGLKKLSLHSCSSLDKIKSMVFLKSIEHFCDSRYLGLNEKKLIENWSNGMYPKLKTYNDKSLQKWKKIIKKENFTSVRRSKGLDVDGGCGQFALKKK
ncbi:hypothetical protein KAH94_03810 [bacterium]|nr:hypothetical protein [bacterium]